MRKYSDFIEQIKKDDNVSFLKHIFKKDINYDFQIKEIWKKLAFDKIILNSTGKNIRGIYLTNSGLIASSYFIGIKNVVEFILLKGGNSKNYFYFDKNKRRIEDYLLSYCDYDVSNITKLSEEEFFWNDYSKKYVKIPKNIEKEQNEKNVLKIKEKFYKILQKKGCEITKNFKRHKGNFYDYTGDVIKLPTFFIKP